MSHFYGTLKGSRGQATRCGTKGSGLTVHAASWRGAVRVCLDHIDGVDYASVWLVPWHGSGVSRQLYFGPVDGSPVDPKDPA